MGYCLSFFIVGLFWFSNRSILARTRRVDGPFTALSLLFLCLICLAPFATALMAQHGPARAMKVYAILVGGTGLVQATLWAYAAFWRELIDGGVDRRERWVTLGAFLTLPATFGLSGAVIRPGTSELAMLPFVTVAAVLGRLRRKWSRTSVRSMRGTVQGGERPVGVGGTPLM